MKYCPKCENKLIEGLKYCFKCGADVDEKNVKSHTIKNVNEDVNDDVNSNSKNQVKTRLSVEVFDVFFN